MPFQWERKVLLAKIEGTYGVDPVPTGAANAILGSNFAIRPLVANAVQRNLEQPYLGVQPQIPTNVLVVCEFDVELQGSGAVDTPVAYGPLLRACALAEAITAATKVAYTPVSDRATMESVALYYNMDGVNHAVLGCRGTVELRARAQDLPHLHFAITGMYVAPAAVALPTPTFTGFLDPLPVTDANTPTFTLHGHTGVMQEFTVGLANRVAARLLVNSESVRIGDRAVAGSCLIEAPALATKDFFALSRAGTLDALTFTHGTVAGKIVEVTAPKVQIASVDYEDGEGDVMLRLGLSFVPNAGNDEIVFTTK